MNGSMLTSTETIPESGKTYNNKDSAIAAKDTKYTSTYETVVNDKRYINSADGLKVSKDKIITYTGSWTTTDIIDLSKAVVEVTPAQAAFTGGKHCSYCKKLLITIMRLIHQNMLLNI